MKRIVTVCAMAAMFAACTNTTKQSVAVRQPNKDSIRLAIIDSLKLDSFQRAEVQKKHDAEVKATALASNTSSKRSSSSSRPTSVKGYSESHTYAEPATTTRKKGWSSAAKGAAIGGAAGAVTGVLVDKKDGRGAIVGGVLGAGTGYIIGRSKDKRTGRAQ